MESAAAAVPTTPTAALLQVNNLHFESLFFDLRRRLCGHMSKRSSQQAFRVTKEISLLERRTEFDCSGRVGNLWVDDFWSESSARASVAGLHWQEKEDNEHVVPTWARAVGGLRLQRCACAASEVGSTASLLIRGHPPRADCSLQHWPRGKCRFASSRRLVRFVGGYDPAFAQIP